MSDFGQPGKYKTLLQTNSAGLRTPRSLLISDDIDEITTTLIDEFIIQASSDIRFIVRSAFSAEDGASLSYAGHFYSSGAVTANQLLEAISHAWNENQRIAEQFAIEGQLSLLVQEYVEHEIGGVLFTPWSFFSDYACVELSRSGVQNVVVGQAETAIIALDSEAESPLELPEDLSFLLPELQAVCVNLRETFTYPVDCEWAWSAVEECIVILQVRPQTHAVGSILALPQNERPDLPAGDWQHTALSESLGRLSPLSFSLLQQLYHDFMPVLRRIGCVAVDSDFLLHLPDGTVLVDAEKERQFYAVTRFGGFWRGFRAGQMRRQAVSDFNAVEDSAAFSYDSLSSVFDGWMLSNVLSDGEGRTQRLEPHAYELSWWNAADSVVVDTKPTVSSGSQWAVLNAQGRTAFMVELGKLKQALSDSPERVFCSWQEYQDSAYTDADLMVKQQALAAQAIYDYAGVANAGLVHDGNLSLAANHVVTGEAFVVLQPGQHYGELPADCILIAPYFDNRWVAAISGLQGIVVQRGSHLAHSVLVAREVGVPYCVLPELDVSALEPSTMLTLDPLQKTLTQAL